MLSKREKELTNEGFNNSQGTREELVSSEGSVEELDSEEGFRRFCVRLIKPFFKPPWLLNTLRTQILGLGDLQHQECLFHQDD